MADSSAQSSSKPKSILIKTAVTRKHLRRDQAADKLRGKWNEGLNKTQNLQQKLKEEKEAKRATLDSRHQHLFSTVATKMQLQDSEVEDYILEGDQVNKYL